MLRMTAKSRRSVAIIYYKTNVNFVVISKNGYANAPQCYAIRTPPIWSEFTVTQERHYYILGVRTNFQ